MRHFILVILTIIFSLSINAQETEKNKPFVVIEEVPVFPGCKGTNKELKMCFSKGIQRHFATKFDAELPNKLNLDPGKIRVLISFKINKDGFIENISAKAPHQKIIEECIKIMSLLPRMIPGKQKGESVAVKYAIPFTMFIEETRQQRKERKRRERLERKKRKKKS